MKIIGIDACKFGWVCAAPDEEVVRIYKTLEKLRQDFPEAFVFIDMPIGLPDAEIPRTCEAEARKILSSKRKSSLFGVPCREAVYAATFKEANTINRRILGNGLSIQSWNIVPKIKELDLFLRRNPSLKLKWKEAHPELAFHVLNNGISMQHNKKTGAGIEERLQVLEQYTKNSRLIYKNSLAEYKRKDVAADDILDALALTLRLEQLHPLKIAAENYTLDAEGLPMRIWY